MSDEIYSLEKVEGMFPDEWIVVEVVERDSDGLPLMVKLLGHCGNKDDVFEFIGERKSVGVFYTGEIFKEDEGFIL